jgi:hypothetical protein
MFTVNDPHRNIQLTIFFYKIVFKRAHRRNQYQAAHRMLHGITQSNIAADTGADNNIPVSGDLADHRNIVFGVR